jgi:hypothetical protein
MIDHIGGISRNRSISADCSIGQARPKKMTPLVTLATIVRHGAS